MDPAKRKNPHQTDHDPGEGSSSAPRTGKKIQQGNTFLAPPTTAAHQRARSTSPGRRTGRLFGFGSRSKSTSRPVTPTSSVPLGQLASTPPPCQNSITTIMSNTTLASPPGALHGNQPGVNIPCSNMKSQITASPKPTIDVAAIHDTIASLRAAKADKERKKWHYTNRHGERVAVADVLGRFLQSVEQYAQIVDVAIQHHPDITALVWSGMRFMLRVSLARIQLMESLEFTLKTVVETMAACEFYAAIYNNSLSNLSLWQSDITAQAIVGSLRSALEDLYKAVQHFTLQAKEYFGAAEVPLSIKVANLFTPFSVKIKPAVEAIMEMNNRVRKYADMATMERISDQSGKVLALSKAMSDIQMILQPLTNFDQLLNAAKQALSVSNATFGVAVQVRDKLDSFQTQIVEALRPYQQLLLSASPLDIELQQLKNRYFADYAIDSSQVNDSSQINDIFDANLYVPARGMPRPHAPDDEHFDLAQRLEDFLLLSNPQIICLIQGTGGSGKSTFNHHIARQLWATYDQSHNQDIAIDPALANSSSSQTNLSPVTRIPVFITLANLHDSTRHNQDLIGEFFRRLDWSEQQITQAKRTLQFVFILDGYDEIEKRDRNFFVDCRLGEWNAKIIVTSRPEYLGPGYQRNFHPPGKPNLLQKYWLAPFSEKDIRRYITQYIQVRGIKVSSDNHSRSGQHILQYYEELLSQPELKSLVSNPFLLCMVMSVRLETDKSSRALDRISLYKRFVQQWLEGSHNRLCRVQLPQELSSVFIFLCDEGFTEHVHKYCQEFAVTLYRYQSIEATYKPRSYVRTHASAAQIHVHNQTDDRDPWEAFLATDNCRARLSLFSSPLLRTGNSYRFLHKSLRDYLIAESFWEDPGLGVRASQSNQPSQPLLNQFDIINDPGVIDFVVQRAHQNQSLQEKLLQCVENSKGPSGKLHSISAANAMTILVRAGRRFYGYDLRGISIPGADLRQGWFERAQLQEADLSRTRLDQIWLRGANLTNALMENAVFGEQPKLEISPRRLPGLSFMSYWVSCPRWTMTEGLLLAAVYDVPEQPNEATIDVLSVGNSRWLHKAVISINKTVAKLPWSVDSEQKYKWGINNIVFSPDGSLIAAVWGHQTNEPSERAMFICSVAQGCILHVLPFYGGYSHYLEFSSNNGVLVIVSCAAPGRGGCKNLCLDVTIVVWSVSVDGQWIPSPKVSVNGALKPYLDTDTDTYSHYICEPLALSPDNRILAGAWAKDIWLWSCVDLKFIQGTVRVPGQFDLISLLFSPDSQMLAVRAGLEVQVWSIRLQKPQLIYNFRCHEILLRSEFTLYSGEYWRNDNRMNTMTAGLAFFRDSRLLAVANHGGVELWSLVNGRRLQVFKFYERLRKFSPQQLVFSDDGSQLAGIFWVDNFSMEVLVFEISEQLEDSCINYDLKYHHDLAKPTSERIPYVDFSPDTELLLYKYGDANGIYTALLAMPNRPLPQPFDFRSFSDPDLHPGVNFHFSRGSQSHFFAFSPGTNGKILVASISPGQTGDGSIHLWSLPTLHDGFQDDNLIQSDEKRADGVNNMVFSPVHKLLATANHNGTVDLWSVQFDHGKLVNCNSSQQHSETQGVSSLAFSVDGRLLASSSKDGVVRLWSVNNQKLELLYSFDEPSDIPSAHSTKVAFSPDGKWLVSGHATVLHNLGIFSLMGLSIWSLQDYQKPPTTYTHFDTHGPTILKHGGFTFSPDSKHLLVFMGKSPILLLLKISRGSLLSISRIPGYKLPFRAMDNITSMVWSRAAATTSESDLGKLALGTQNSVVHVWSVKRLLNNASAGPSLLDFTCLVSTNHGIFNVGDLNIKGVRGLRRIDYKLLKQRGAIGTPAEVASESGGLEEWELEESEMEESGIGGSKIEESEMEESEIEV